MNYSHGKQVNSYSIIIIMSNNYWTPTRVCGTVFCHHSFS